MRFALLKARKQAGLTQDELASIVGISRDKYSNIETGKRAEVDAVLAVNISKALGKPLEEIFLPGNE